MGIYRRFGNGARVRGGILCLGSDGQYQGRGCSWLGGVDPRRECAGGHVVGLCMLLLHTFLVVAANFLANLFSTVLATLC